MTYKQLTETERYQIFSLKEAGFSQREISKSLNQNPSTISRELRRNQEAKKYAPAQAQLKAVARRHCATKAVKVKPEIEMWIKQLIWQDLSPEQTVGYLKRENIISLHHETVYRLIYNNKLNGGDLWQHLRIAKKPYRKRYGSYERRGKIKTESVLISAPNWLIKSSVLVIGKAILSLVKIIKVHY
ncbi:transposase (fragment) [Xenorhabdus bovienii]|uniref:Transposase n=2 Tax=Xenorhabdus bovienii TaxID=40576 RepID=A0A0B6XAS7_XENBV